MAVVCAEQLGIITVKCGPLSAFSAQHFLLSLTSFCSDTATLAPSRNAYVKVYIKLKSGIIEFYKDGHTDRRGKFDYVSLNTGQMKHAADIALLVCGADGDCNVTRASPPAGI